MATTMLTACRIMVAMLCLFALLMLAGCNTVAGFGRDLEDWGQSLQDAAEE